MTTADYIRDAADPLAQALQAVQDLGVKVPSVDVLIAYTDPSLVFRVADRSAAHQEAIEDAFREAFQDAGWGVAVRYLGGLTLQHPIELTRLSHSD
ncbi:hypothetical protein ACWEGQ_00365 [Streptomyces seoulensis]